MFTKLLKSSTTRDTLISLAGIGTIAGLGMVFTIVAARFLGPESFGVYSALSAVVTLLASMGDMGISAAMVNFLPKIKNDRHTLISVSFWFQLIITLIISLLLIVISPTHRFLVPGSNSWQFVIIGLLTGIYILQGFAIGVLNAEKKFLHVSIVQGMDSAVKMAIALALLSQKSFNIELAFVGNIISCSLSVIYGLRSEYKNIRPIFPKQQLVEIFTFAKWIALSRTFSVAISRVDVLMLNSLANSFQAGIYAAASRISLLFALVVSALGGVIAPRFSALKKRDEVISYLKKVILMVSGIAVLMLLTVLIADPIVRLVFGVKYLSAIPVFQAITIAMIPFLFSVVTTQPLIYSFNQPKFFATTTIIQVVSLILLDYYLIPLYGAFGPAIGMGLTNILVLLITGSRLIYLLRK